MTSANHTIAPAAKPGRIDRAYLDAATFPSVLEMPIRFEDLDVLWHVNNVSVIAFLQEARVHFQRTMTLPPLGEGLRTVVGGMTVEYAEEMTYPGKVSISSGIWAIGKSSYSFAQLIRQNGKSTVYSQITMVITGTNGPAVIPQPLRQALIECSLS